MCCCRRCDACRLRVSKLLLVLLNFFDLALGFAFAAWGAHAALVGTGSDDGVPIGLWAVLFAIACWVLVAVLCSYGGMYVVCCRCMLCCSAGMFIFLGMAEATIAVILMVSNWIGTMLADVEATFGSIPAFLLNIDNTPGFKLVIALLLIALSMLELFARPLASRAVATGIATALAYDQHPSDASAGRDLYQDWGVSLLVPFSRGTSHQVAELLLRTRRLTATNRDGENSR
eukprot:SAG31_NODE_5449_length_2532_cov_1.899712_2_plen_231_part_00